MARGSLSPWVAALALLAASAAPALGAPAAPAPRVAAGGWEFGEKVAVRNCLRFQVSDYRDRQSDVENHDWVHLRVENGCPATLRNVLVELLLIDTRAVRYGTPVWVVGRGEQLIPGAVWEDDVAIPDPDSRVAKRWALRVLRADALPRPPPKAAKK